MDRLELIEIAVQKVQGFTTYEEYVIAKSEESELNFNKEPLEESLN